MTACLSLETLRRQYPTGSTVSCKDTTLRPSPKARTGLVDEVRLSLDGNPYIRVQMPNSVLDTIPENVTLLRTPGSTITPHDERLD
jgi:hypothetical protein